MPYKLFPQTPADSFLRQINPSLGPLCRTNWSAGHIERNRRIYDYELVFFSSGSGRILTENGVFDCRSGSVAVIPPALPHCTVSDSPMERWCIHFDWFGDCPVHAGNGDIFVYMDEAPFLEKQCAKPPPEVMQVHFPLFRQLDKTEAGTFRQLIQDFFLADTGKRSGELKRQGLFYAILGNLLEELSPATNGNVWKNNRFLSAKNIIDSDFADPELNCTAVAVAVGMSTNHLAKLFRTMTGLSTQEYLTMRRMELARELLSGSSAGVAEIVEQCGFNDANYFARYFRKCQGMSPSQYREENAKGRGKNGAQCGT